MMHFIQIKTLLWFLLTTVYRFHSFLSILLVLPSTIISRENPPPALHPRRRRPALGFFMYESQLAHTRLPPSGKSTTEALLPQEVKACTPPSSPADKLLSVSSREPPDRPLHSLVHQLHGREQEGPAASGEGGRTCHLHNNHQP